MEKPMVSIIVTAFNQVETITKTLNSILLQKCNFPFEIIIGDDCSTDGTRDICIAFKKKYPEIISLLFQKINVGIATNFVSSVEEAKGKYIAVCAADDFWHNESKLQLEVDFLDYNEDYGFVYTDFDKLNIKTGKTTKSWIKTSKIFPYQGEGLINQFFTGKVPALTLTVLFRKEIYDKYIPASDYIKYKFPIEDWPTWLIMSKYTKFGYLSDSTATYRFGHESLSNPKTYYKIEEKYAREKIMYKYLCDMFPEDLQYDVKEYDIYVLYILLNKAFKQKDFNKAKEFGQKIDIKSIKVICSKNRILFWIYVFLKRIRN